MSSDVNLNLTAKKAGLWYTVGNFLLKGCVFLSLPLFTRLLSTGDFGVYNTYIAYEGILASILGLGFYGTVKNAKLKYADDFDAYFSSIVSFSIALLLLFLALANGLYSLYSPFVGYSRFVINVLVCQSFGTSLLQLYASKLNIEFKYKSFICLSAINTIGNIGISVLLILFAFPNERYLGRILGTAIPLLAIALFVISIAFSKGKKVFSGSFWKYALVLGLPLVPHAVSQSLLSQFDRIMISSMVGDSESGIYSFVYTVCTILFVLASSLDNAWTPWVYMKKKDLKDNEIKSASKIYFLFFSLMTLGFVCVMPEISKLFGDSSYWDGLDLIVPLSLSNFFIFLYFMPVNIEYYAGKTIFISIGTVCAAILNFILNYWLIPIFGYKAAAYTTFASYLLLFLGHFFFAIKYDFRKAYDLLFIVIGALIVCCFSFSVLIIQKIEVFGIVYRYILALGIIIFLIVKRNMFLSSRNTTKEVKE